MSQRPMFFFFNGNTDAIDYLVTLTFFFHYLSGNTADDIFWSGNTDDNIFFCLAALAFYLPLATLVITKHGTLTKERVTKSYGKSNHH